MRCGSPVRACIEVMTCKTLPCIEQGIMAPQRFCRLMQAQANPFVTLFFHHYIADSFVGALAGVADRSFGLNVARMAHLPREVVACAAQRASEMELSTLQRIQAR